MPEWLLQPAPDWTIVMSPLIGIMVGLLAVLAWDLYKYR